MSIELVLLFAKLATSHKPYALKRESKEDQQKKLTEIKNNLREIYKSGIATDIARINNGNGQKGLKLQSYGGIFDDLKKRYGLDLTKSYEENLATIERESPAVDLPNNN